MIQEALYLPDTDSLHKVLTIWQEIVFKGMEENVIQFISFTSQKDRQNGVKIIGILTPALINFRGPIIADELYRTITDMARWWP